MRRGKKGEKQQQTKKWHGNGINLWKRLILDICALTQLRHQTLLYCKQVTI